MQHLHELKWFMSCNTYMKWSWVALTAGADRLLHHSLELHHIPPFFIITISVVATFPALLFKFGLSREPSRLHQPLRVVSIFSARGSCITISGVATCPAFPFFQYGLYRGSQHHGCITTSFKPRIFLLYFLWVSCIMVLQHLCPSFFPIWSCWRRHGCIS